MTAKIYDFDYRTPPNPEKKVGARWLPYMDLEAIEDRSYRRVFRKALEKAEREAERRDAAIAKGVHFAELDAIWKLRLKTEAALRAMGKLT